MTHRWTNWNDSLEKIDFRFILSQFVDSFALVIAILTLLDGDDTQGGVGEFVSSGKVRDAVMLIVG